MSGRVPARALGLAGVVALSGVLGTYRLAQNGYANTFYSAAVKSMLASWHNVLFLSFDPGGLISIDKPPLGVWTQAASAGVFGLAPLSLLLPEAIIATVTVAVLYRIVARRLGAAAGLGAALVLATFPSFVAVSRDNGPDPLLILLMVLACGAALNAVDTGRDRWLLAAAGLIALAFNTKTLAAYLVVPGILITYLVCAPGSARRRAGMTLLAAAIIGIGSFAWIALVDATPASQRPYIGDTTDNSELSLTFNYNGFGRVGGEIGAVGRVPTAPGAIVQSRRPARAATRGGLPPRAAPPLRLPDGRLRNPITSPGPAGPLRVFGPNLADQAAWVLPLAIVGMLAFALLVRRAGRRDPRVALLLTFGGWLVCELFVLSFSRGIIHPYYTSALAPGVAVMVSAGMFAAARSATPRDWRLVLVACAVAATVAVQLAILSHQGFMRWWEPMLVALATLGSLTLLVRRFAPAALGLLFAVLLVAPTAYATTTWLAPVQGTFPAAGPHQAAGSGEYGVDAERLRADRHLIAYVSSHRPGTRWRILTVASPTAAPLILLGSSAAAMGGYDGTNPALDGPGLARLVRRGWARYVLLGGDYASRGGNRASQRVLRSCPEVPARTWRGTGRIVDDLALFDCAGRERALGGLRR